jgi:hypothetical protein
MFEVPHDEVSPTSYYLSLFLPIFLGIIFSSGARGSVVVRHYATNRKVTGSIPDEVIFKFT